ncbi:hypothetical protein [Rummeliibacillus pycnus]|uniref:hypothetical protein n=1 Tax=Rummeliibacillus pycnus TaxID=101070 RepID=UPI0037C66D4E
MTTLLSSFIFLAIFFLIIFVVRKILRTEQWKPKHMKIILTIYGILLIVATLYVCFMKNDVNIMDDSEKAKIENENEDFSIRAERHQLKGKDEAFYVKSFKQDIKGNRLFLTANTSNDNINVYVERVDSSSYIVEGEVYHSNAYYKSLNLNDEMPYVKVDWQFPHTLRFTEPQIAEKTYSVVTDVVMPFPFNPESFKGDTKTNSSIFNAQTVVSLKVPKHIDISDPNHLIWKAE